MRSLSTTFYGFFATALLASGAALACINETGTDRSGREIAIDMDLDSLESGLVTPLVAPRALSEWAQRTAAKARQEPTFENLNQLGVALIRLKRPKPAIALLESVERRYPGHWQTAPNLGTAYELDGQDGPALRWIKEGIRRNGKDHGGTEWLHAAILSAKLHKRARVLDLDFGNGPLPRLPLQLPLGNDGRRLQPAELRLALQVQLVERAQFVRTPDPIMAKLLFAWGQMELIDGTMEVADIAYAAAERYGWPDRVAIQRGRTEAARVLARAKVKPSARRD